ncbi:ATP-binding protein [Rhodocaloribacter litoris]|uniref:ATP-binding protein n=1 Tax=Rhodocaloribacter litoris TaxID=2558931 RepID=UPI0014241ED0|nr:ATP-binding protein [Rhodocaloribacter litoris]QXD13940.1 ATP-binding protein [Rhodocaloribacter litoris]
MSEVATMSEINLDWNPGRVLFGLSRIGYTPASALCDLVDNAVRANASAVHILIHKEREDLSDRSKNNVREYLIIDDGDGMDEAGLKNALMLGSSDLEYENHALCKFGLGLKSASLSQGDELHVISSTGDGNFLKYILSLPAIQNRGQYFATKAHLSEEDRALIDEYLTDGRGTIIRIGQVRKNNHPSVRSTVEELEYKIGVIYFYFMKEDGLKIYVDGKEISPFDVLFIDEANANGNLDENEWDGRSTRWIQRPKDISIDADYELKARIEVTQLPYPPIFDLDGAGEQAKIRDKYRIGAGNYGFYVYRNKRLISWAERFGGIIPQDQDYYSFRGRILIDDSADDAFNIDVKKATITLSDDAERTISDYSANYKSKSKKAWNRANNLRKERQGDDPNLVANQIVEEYTPPPNLPGEGIPSTEEIQKQRERETELQEEMRDKLRKETARKKQEKENQPISEEELTEEDLEAVLRENTHPAAHKIFQVSTILDNLLWEPYHDAEHEHCVRINRGHRFGRLIYDDNHSNTDLQVIFELMLLQLAIAEVYAQKNLTKYKRENVNNIVTEFRRYTSEFLADMCRKLDHKLPKSSS